MKKSIASLHHHEYVHMKCCYHNLYDIKVRIEFLDYLNMMKKYPMTPTLSLSQRIMFFFHKIHFYIFEIDLEILREAFDSMRCTYEILKDMEASEAMIKDYAMILKNMQKLLVMKGHLD